MSNDSISKTIGVALGVCLVCSILVSAAAVSLKGIQKENQKLERLKNILAAGHLLQEGEDPEAVFEKRVTAAVINLNTGEEVPPEDYTEKLNPQSFDIKQMARDPQYGQALPGDQDQAGIGRMPRFMVIYKVKEGDNFSELILPIYGKGLWSTMYGFIALDADLRTIKGLTFYEQGETPGLGGEVDNPNWKRLWVGKEAFDIEGRVVIQVIKGKVSPDDPGAKHKVDGLSGSTLTTRGVNNLVRFWLGDQGYGTFFRKLRGEA